MNVEIRQLSDAEVEIVEGGSLSLAEAGAVGGMVAAGLGFLGPVAFAIQWTANDVAFTNLATGKWVGTL